MVRARNLHGFAAVGSQYERQDLERCCYIVMPAGCADAPDLAQESRRWLLRTYGWLRPEEALVCRLRVPRAPLSVESKVLFKMVTLNSNRFLVVPGSGVVWIQAWVEGLRQ